MKILWLTNVMLPEFAEELGLTKINQGGWLPSLVSALRKYASSNELMILCRGAIRATRKIDLVTYQSVIDIGEVANVIDEFKPQVIHVHGTEGVWAGLPKSTFKGIPVEASLQGVINGCYPHYSGNLCPFETRSALNLPNILLTRYTIQRAAKRWSKNLAASERNAFAAFDAFLGRTEWDLAWTNYLNPKAKYFTVGEVLREPFYRGGRSEAAVVPHRIYCGASMSYPLKGGHWLLRAIAVLKRKYPDIKLRVANAEKVAKPKDIYQWLRQGEYHRYLCKLIRELGIEDNVDLLPSLTADQVADELKHAEVFCLPSMCENSPNSLGEAMLMGVPCVATDVGGTETILKKGEQGALVPSGDPAILAHWIDKLFEDKELAQRFSHVGQEDARSRYNPKMVVGQLMEAYRKVCA